MNPTNPPDLLQASRSVRSGPGTSRPDRIATGDLAHDLILPTILFMAVGGIIERVSVNDNVICWGRLSRPAICRTNGARRQARQDQEFKPLLRGWCLGSQVFRTDMLQYLERQKGKWHYGKELRESAPSKAERLIKEACRREGVGAELPHRWRKGRPFKVKLALQSRAETTVTVGWIAQRLHMGTREHAAHLLCRARKVPREANSQPALAI